MRLSSIVMYTATACLALLCLSCGGNGNDRGTDEVDSSEAQESSFVPVEDSRLMALEFISARHILVTWDDTVAADVPGTVEEAEALIMEIRDRIIAGDASFEEMAIEYSDCSTASEGGLLPEFTRGAMLEDFETVILSLEPGEVSGIVETRFGYHLIQRIR